MARALKEYDKLSLIEKRLWYLVGARLRDKDRISLALKKQDEIRKNHPAHSGWNSAAVIRSWREAR
ncbi:MAG: hypothetical protein QXS96_05095 [Candidatus Caldarchaeum sp.]